MRPAAIALTLLLLPSGLRAQDLSLNEKVLEYARSQLGKTVGNGECTTLAIAALVAVKAKSPVDYKLPRAGDYVWGRAIDTFDEAQPGDILQFRDVKLEFPAPKGAAAPPPVVFAHHTAIVSANLGKGKFKVLEQNAGGRFVQEHQYDFSRKTEGAIYIYRPEKK